MLPRGVQTLPIVFAKGLDTILAEMSKGDFSFKRALEDIHMNVEARLGELIGPAAGRLHTARSRNDQVALDFRLWVRDAIDEIDNQIRGLQIALAERAQQFAFGDHVGAGAELEPGLGPGRDTQHAVLVGHAGREEDAVAGLLAEEPVRVGQRALALGLSGWRVLRLQRHRVLDAHHEAVAGGGAGLQLPGAHGW